MTEEHFTSLMCFLQTETCFSQSGINGTIFWVNNIYIYYLNKEARQARHSLWQDIVRRDEEAYGQSNYIDDYYDEEEDEDQEDDEEDDEDEEDEDEEDDEEEDQEGEDEEEE
eukprot:scaffold31410_cov72-Skeletonema_dohrnii-CCMP3373.AAC.2